MPSSALVPAKFPLPAPARKAVDVLVIAGEHSGDEQAARMVKAALARNPDLNVVALGGEKLKRAGAQVVCDMMPYAIVGIFEILKHYSELKQLRDAIIAWIIEYRPKAVCFVDYPGLNLRLAKILAERKLTRKTGGAIRLLYYISPQVWAWKAKRRFEMAELLDTLGVIFPFEVGTFADTKLETKFVGHPFVAGDYELPARYDSKGPVLLLPGSRAGAISRIAPVMFESFWHLLDQRPGVRAQCVYASESLKVLLESILADYGGLRNHIELVSNKDVVEASCVLTSSGTMSLNCALSAIPGAIVYRIHPMTYLFGKMVLKIPFIGIANLLLKQAMYPEFIQGAAQPDILAKQLVDCIENPERIERTSQLSEALRRSLDKPSTGGAGSWLVENIAL